jgi:hypothetical protein
MQLAAAFTDWLSAIASCVVAVVAIAPLATAYKKTRNTDVFCHRRRLLGEMSRAQS